MRQYDLNTLLALENAKQPKKKSKYKNTITEVDGIAFHSKREAKRYADLRFLERHGAIRDLELQPVYPIVINGVKVCKVIADFRYVDVKTGKVIVEDTKGFFTDTSKLKCKLVLACHGVEIIIVK